MSKLDNFIARHYDDENGKLTFNALLEMIEKQMDNVSVISEALPADPSDAGSFSITWDGIPELQLTELAWGAATAEGENPSEARVQLERFLEQIGIGRSQDFAGKLRALSSFYGRSEKTGKAFKLGKQRMEGAGINLEDPKQTIGRIMGYLVFFKTLTRILQNFNASAAGFTFESFVAVLLGGEQIPTGNQTIADLTSGTGKPISLKLLSDKAANVKGSVVDLVNDLAGLGSTPVKKMNYLIALKQLAGEGPTLEGAIKFYEFDFAYESMLDYLSAGAAHADNLKLPMGEDGVTPDPGRSLRYEEHLPAYSGEEVDDDRREWWEANFEQIYEQVAIQSGITDADAYREGVLALLKSAEIGEPGKVGKVAQVETFLINNYDSVTSKAEARSHPAWALAYATRKALQSNYVAADKAYRKAVDKGKNEAARVANYASQEDSIKHMRALQEAGDKKAFFEAMMKTYGYVTRKQWLITVGQIEATRKALGEGDSYTGSLFIGQAHVHEMVNMYREIINEKVFSIFRDLKVLTDSLNDFFAGGLQPEPANTAIAASDSIGTKTYRVQEEVNPDQLKIPGT